MVNIERLLTTIKKPHLTLCDLVNKDNTKGNNFLWMYPASHLLKSFVEKKLTNVSIGKHFGVQGIDIKMLFTNQFDCIVELTYSELLEMPAMFQKKLLSEYTVIISDLEEGGAGFGVFNKCIIKHISSLEIIPKRIYCLVSGYNQQDYKPLNITAVYIPVWAIMAVTCDSFYTDIIFDESKKSTALETILNADKKLGICLNKKPRYHRVKMLAELHQRQLLDDIDWSLIYHTESPGGRPGNFIDNPNNFRFSRIVKQSQDKDICLFLDSYAFPKHMQDYKHATMGDSIGPSPTWLGKYKFYIGNETYAEPKATSLGTTHFLTEKTFKPMCIGAYPLINGMPGSVEHATNLGFKFLNYDYDSLGGDERINAICDILEKKMYSEQDIKQAVEHNFLLITDPDFLSDILAKPANSIANDLLNR